MKGHRVGSPAKGKLLEAAQSLMLAKSYAATSVDEICHLAGVSKGTFFHYFGSKEDIGKAALQRFFGTMAEALQRLSPGRKQDALERVYESIELLIRMWKDPQLPKSCLVGNLAQELANTHPGIRELCGELFDQWASNLKVDLDEAKAKYAPQAPWETQSLADHLIAIFEGSLILAKSKQDPDVVEKSLCHYRRYIEALFGRPSGKSIGAGGGGPV